MFLFSYPLKASLQNLESIRSSLIPKANHGRPERTDDFDCTLCLKLLYEPITTPCGHSFCRSCLFQSMDRGDYSIHIKLSYTFLNGTIFFLPYHKISGNKCPLCRTVLFISPRACAIRFVTFMFVLSIICRIKLVKR